MVYRGKPSRGCANCRKRKIRCDQTVPKCGQCVAWKRPCPGYRSQVDLMFVDQSNQVAEKVRRESPPNATPSPLAPVVSGQSGNLLGFSKRPQPLSQPLDQLAVNFFMANYVGRQANQYQFDYLPDFCQQPGIDRHFHLSIFAVGLAGYATVNNVPELVHTARAKYSSAIREVNLALASEDTAKKDSTLISVMLLGLFEVIMSPSQQALETLVTHLNGAIELAKLRSREQFKTDLGARLFNSLSLNIVITSLMQSNPIPDDFIRLRQYIPDLNDPNKPQPRFLDLMIRWINLMRKIDSGLVAAPSDIQQSCIQLDNDMKYFAATMPPAWQYRVVYTDADPELIYQGCYYLYRGTFVAQLLNNLRLARVRLHKLILTQAIQALHVPTSLSAHLVAQVETSKTIILQLAAEICATVPQLAGYASTDGQDLSMDPDLPSSIPISPQTILKPAIGNSEGHRVGHHFLTLWAGYASLKNRENQQGTPETPKTAGGYQLVWPLFVISQIVITPPAMREWVVNRMRYIAQTLSPDYVKVLQNHLARHGVGANLSFGPGSDLSTVFGTSMHA
ncbi:uncharacterized protein BDZ99DRAFT_427842 [Mytilinidion resinicola]|uniref:Zn(2)-C6 fungal-type domain-containing protein n=1 Tax=Mytilinidion resinicola TaxID=574789 RepID=A0A6A6Y3R7_9PEZI|nr:uncharacterized protein BDZ99DRAFT_427842 [Mytilinidion resinicola]KAF2802875.1 hypothetical protein BDZ99DRAFT_427842 [Mytilinidion resinicola]